MGIKKWMTICIIFLVGMSVLAHNVLPHCYHDNVVCLSVKHAAHCDADTMAEGHSDHHHNHGHNHNHFGDCPFKNTIVRHTDNNIQHLMPVMLLVVHHCCGLIGCYLEEPPVIAFSEQKPYLKSYYTQYVVPTLGLRAPPRI